MNVKRNPKVNPNFEELLNSGNNSDNFLTLHNDDVNSFEYVIDSLIEVCNHDIVQAEQCAYLTHYKGQCDVKRGNAQVLKPMREQLIVKGLTATIN